MHINGSIHDIEDASKNLLSGVVIGCKNPYFIKENNRIYQDYFACFLLVDSHIFVLPTRKIFFEGASVPIILGGIFFEYGLKVIEPGTGTELDLSVSANWDAGTYWLSI